LIFCAELNLVDLLGVEGVEGLSKDIKLGLGTAKDFRAGPKNDVIGLSGAVMGLPGGFKKLLSAGGAEFSFASSES